MSEFDTNLDAKTAATMRETDKKCPSCGGVMDFDPATSGLACPYCGHIQAIGKEVKKQEPASELAFSEAEFKENQDWGVRKKTVICKACGAETVYDALEIASECPFCGSNQVMEAADRETMAPGGVVPFQVTDEKAASLFKGWIRKKWFCPKLAKESARARHFKGVYLPYWTFDAKTESTYRADYGKERRVKKGDEVEIVTDWYPTKGTYRESFDDELVCATTNHSQSMLMGIEPYDTAANKSYRPEYVAGFAAERYAVGLGEGWRRRRAEPESRSQFGSESVRWQRIPFTTSSRTGSSGRSESGKMRTGSGICVFRRSTAMSPTNICSCRYGFPAINTKIKSISSW